LINQRVTFLVILCLDVVFLGYFPARDNSYFYLGIIDENQL
jgi:hypothetical protein